MFSQLILAHPAKKNPVGFVTHRACLPVVPPASVSSARSGEGRRPGQQDVEQHPEGPQVALLVVPQGAVVVAVIVVVVPYKKSLQHLEKRKEFKLKIFRLFIMLKKLIFLMISFFFFFFFCNSKIYIF